MAYPKQLLKLRPTKGIASDTPAHALSTEFYSTGNNVQMRRGFAGRVLGSRAVYGTMPVNPVMHLLNARIGQTNYWLVFGADEIHALETENSDEVTPSGGLQTVDSPHQWSSTLLNGVPVASNGLDAPMYWAGNVETPFTELPDWPPGTICKSIVAFKFHLFAFDIDGPNGHFPMKMMWSDAAEPGTVPDSWTPSAENEAGDAELADTPGPILCALPLRGSLIVYKRSSMYAVDYVGGNEKFAVRTLFTSSGALTRHAVCDLNGEHFVVTDGDIIITDGTNRRSVGQARMKEYLFSQLDQDNYENLFVVYHRAENEVWVCFPESGNTLCTKALVYDVSNDAFGVRDLDDVTCAAVGIVNDAAVSEDIDDQDIIIDEDTRTINQQNFSFATESLVVGYGTTMEMQDTQDAVALDATIARYDLTFDAPERVKFVKRVHVLANPGFGTLSVRVGGRMTPTGAITWSAQQTLTEPNQIVNCNAVGRYIAVEVSSSGSNVWLLSGIDIEAEMRGYF